MKKTLIVIMPEDLHMKFRLRVWSSKKTMKQVVIKMIEDYLKLPD